MPYVFSYGTLQEEPVQRATFGRRLGGSPDVLPGFAPARVPVRDPRVTGTTGMTHYDNGVATGDPADKISGTVFELDEKELADADGYEATADYSRIEVTLQSGRVAWVYVHRGGR